MSTCFSGRVVSKNLLVQTDFYMFFTSGRVTNERPDFTNGELKNKIYD